MKNEDSRVAHIWQVEKPAHFRYSLSYEDIPALVSCYDKAYLLTSPVIDIVCFKLPTDPEEFSVELYIGFPDRETRMQPRLFTNLILQSGRLFLTRWRCGDFRAAGQPSTPSTICWGCLKDKGSLILKSFNFQTPLC